MRSARVFLLVCFPLLSVTLPSPYAWNEHFEDPELFEGDMIMGKETRAARKDLKWDNARVPYVLDNSLTEQQKKLAKEAMQEFHKVSCVRFVERTNERIYYTIRKGSGCRSTVGVDKRALFMEMHETGCSRKDIFMHELMHGIGFHHEQTRKDRDKFVDVQLWNVGEIQDAQGMVNMSFNFDIDPLADTLGMPYDYCSIMHYGPTAFGKLKMDDNGTVIGEEITMVIKNPPTDCIVGEVQKFSELDIKKINLLYPCGDVDNSTTDPGVPETTTRMPWTYLQVILDLKKRTCDALKYTGRRGVLEFQHLTNGAILYSRCVHTDQFWDFQPFCVEEKSFREENPCPMMFNGPVRCQLCYSIQH